MKSEILKGVYLQFAMQVLQGEDVIPHYDQIYGMINDEFERRSYVPVVSWLSTAEGMDALQNPPPTISQIADPRLIGRFTYPRVKIKFFFDLYHRT